MEFRYQKEKKKVIVTLRLDHSFAVFIYFCETVSGSYGKAEREGDRGAEVESVLTAANLMWGLNSQTVRS